VGDIVPAAIPVAHLPGNITIKAGKLRGVPSNGMLCSIAELGLTLHDMPEAIEDGIFILGKDYEDKIGMDVKEALLMNDTVVEFEITSNRPDCLSVIGLARETAVTFDRELTLKTPTVTEADGDICDYLSVSVDEPELCPRYMARVIKNVRIAPSPLWLRMRLRASGVRPINNIVDITNYVMLEYGQPMHAFDYAMLDGKKIVVRLASEGEIFKSLDDKDHSLKASNLVIADSKKAVALAGVMGGANSEIKDSTETVVFECANFNGASVRLSAKSQGMRTESSGRFEKGLDPENCLMALDRACELVTLLDAGDVVCGKIDVYKKHPEKVTVNTTVSAINNFLGTSVSADRMIEIFQKLEVSVESDGEALTLTAPSFRCDLACMPDYAEEIARIYGYNNIESTPFKGNVAVGALTEKQQFKAKLHNTLCAMGLSQSITFSFVSPKDLDKIAAPKDDARRNQLVISNPLGEDTSVMRTSLIPGLLSVLAHNNNHHSDGAAMYELAHVYVPNEDPEKLPAEPLSLALGFYGSGDFYDLKGMVENIIEQFGIVRPKFVANSENPTFHPGRCADVIVRGNQVIATIGQIHPKVADAYGFDSAIYVADVDVEKLFDFANTEKHYKPLPKFPTTTRDYSFLVERDLEAGSIEEVMRRAGGKTVENVVLFDVYKGDKIPADKKSMAFRVTMRAQDHTLTVDEAEKVSEKILAALNKQLGIALRS
jgi:phenylalanyl-tRNA synthetase beta chain